MVKAERDIFSLADAERIGRRRIPVGAQQFFDGGTEAALTIRENRRAFEDVLFMPRAAVTYPSRKLATTVLGQELSMPVVLAPAGYIRLAHRDGEQGCARAAHHAGIAAAVSTMSSHDIVDIGAQAPGRVWYQVYFAGGRTAAEVAIERAKQAGCTALLVTVDLAGRVRRETGKRGGSVTRRVDMNLARLYAGEVARRPWWLVQFLRGGLRFDLPNVRTSLTGPPLSVEEASARMRASAPTWDDLTWIREAWPGPLAVKGIVRPDDARRARDCGADGVVVSNHGGNALDGTVATLRALPGVVAAVGSDLDVLLDGGIRRGSDVVKALALGAKAVLIGRAYIWGLAAAGTAGVSRILELLRAGIDGTLALIGCPSINDLDASYLDLPASWPGRS
jgi:isopentenyl diphosphate isomerase/L-lactate dehydrogenase-like FMN-dependent dehydrogenase